MTITAICTLQNGFIVDDSFDDSSGENFSVYLYRPSFRLAMGKQMVAMLTGASREDVR
jgi:hypothetical protein